MRGVHEKRLSPDKETPTGSAQIMYENLIQCMKNKGSRTVRKLLRYMCRMLTTMT